MFGLIGVGKRAGMGVPKILRVCETYGLKGPKLFDEYAPPIGDTYFRLNKKEGQQDIQPEKKQPNLTEKRTNDSLLLSFAWGVQGEGYFREFWL